MRAVAVGVGIAVAVALWILGSIFGLNGQQWRWWRWAAFAGAGLILIVAVFRSTLRVALGSGGDRSAVLAGGVSGAALVALSVSVMAHRYSDPYSGPLFWPHALAVIALVGWVLIVVSVAFWPGGTHRRV